MIRNIKVITVSSYMAMFFLGVSASLIGAAARNIGLSPFEIGLMLAVQNIGFMLSITISGALADTHEKPKILLVGSLILALSFFTFYAIDLFWINLVIMFLIGAGVATYEGVTDAMLLEIHTRRQSMHINVNHFFVTFGAMLIAVYLLFLQMNWRISVIQSGVVVLLLAVVFGLTKLENKHKQIERYTERLKILTRERTIVILFVVSLLAVGVEVGTMGILTTSLMELRGFTQITSKIGLIVFLAGVATGRLLVGFFSKDEQIMQYILALFGLSFLFYTGLFYLDLGNMIYIAIFLSGLALSALLPLLITLTGLLYQDMAGTALGTIKIAFPLGGILIPLLMSIVARQISLQAALLLFPVACLLGFVILFFTIRNIKPVETTPVVEAAR